MCVGRGTGTSHFSFSPFSVGEKEGKRGKKKKKNKGKEREPEKKLLERGETYGGFVVLKCFSSWGLLDTSFSRRSARAAALADAS
jgi:hypothetical protein